MDDDNSKSSGVRGFWSRKPKGPAERKVRRAGIVSIGKYMPPKVLTNRDFEKLIDTSDEWIVQRTGIKERHFILDGQLQSDLALRASQEAMARVGWSAADLDLIIVASVTPDHIFPSSSNSLAGKLGAIGTPSMDILAACSGFVYAMYQGVTAIECGRADRVLVVGSEVMSSIIDWEDRGTCILFGDGAGAILLEPVDENCGIQDILIGSDGRQERLLYMLGGGSAHPASHETVAKGMHLLRMEGKEVFKLAVRTMADVCLSLMEHNNLRPEDIKVVLPHQANIRIIEATQKALGLEDKQIYINIDRYGNTTSATIPTCLYDAESEGIITEGDWVIMCTFGAGLTWAGALIKWCVGKLPTVRPAEADDVVGDSYSDKLKPGRGWEDR